ncbi:MAG: nucleotidyltransferase domain-containing protein [Dehalococcoidales bacterium]|nr:nucleotidyltransferase domain-containing protein [Dehalococcoidales bacterium]
MLIMVMNGFDKQLSAFLFNKTRRGLLALLYGRPDEKFYINQLMQATGSGSGAVQRELKLMTGAGIVVRERMGNLVYYQANSHSPIFTELKNIVRKTFAIDDVKKPLDMVAERFRVPPEKLAEFCRKNHIVKLALFGSVLREDFRPDSDVDVLVEFDPGHVPGLFGMADMETQLSALVGGRKVDIRTAAELSRYFRDRVVREAKVQYATA